MNIAILGGTGNLGSTLVLEALRLQHQVTVLVRSTDRWSQVLDADLRSAVRLIVGDATDPVVLTDLLDGQEAVINSAGHASRGSESARIVDTLFTSAEAHREFAGRIWFLGGLALLDLLPGGPNSIGLPFVPEIYRTHGVNWLRAQRSCLEWSIACPGPMVHGVESLPAEVLTVAVDQVPFAFERRMLEQPPHHLGALFGEWVPRTTVTYQEVARLILSDLGQGGRYVGRRVGLALPEGLSRQKAGWSLSA